MKKILIILGTISLVGTSTTNLVACNTPQYNEDKLKELKQNNNINTKDGILEWIAPQEKPFNEVDNKYYFVVWQSPDSLEFKISKFLNNSLDDFKKNKIIDNFNDYNLVLTYSPNIYHINDLGVRGSFFFKGYFIYNLPRKYFNSVYRWNIDTNIPDLDVNNKTGELKIK